MKANRKILNYTIAIIISLCCVCLVGALGIYSYGGTIISTPISAQPVNTSLPISEIIALTSSAAQTQTMQAMPPTSIPAATLAPTLEPFPTATVFIFDLQTSVAQPTEFIYSTNTPLTLATQEILATLPPQSAVCSCSGDSLNCSDFGSHSSAQACFSYCVSQGAGDIHKLDGNNDGNACESLP